MHSIVLVGHDREAEASLTDVLGGDAARFFRYSQRIAWGVSQADIFRVDVEASVAGLERLYSRCPATHLLAAYALRAGAPGRAEAALARARALTPADHPFAYLLPRDGEWACEAPPQRLDELIAGRVWRVAAYFPLTGAPFPVVSIATIIRMEDGGLALFNPVPFERGIADRIRELGPVRHVVSQGKAHSRFVEAARALFPGARILGTVTHRSHPAASHVRFDGFLDNDGASALPEECELFPLTGTELEEVVVVHRPTNLLVCQDLFMGNLAEDRAVPFAMRIYKLAFGVIDRVGIAAYQPMLWNDLPRLQRGLRRLLDARFTAAVCAHSSGANERTRDGVMAAFRWTCGLSQLSHAALLARYFATQPGFLRDLMRYKLNRRRLEAA